MPLYEYKCTKCAKMLEELRSFNKRDEKTQCPECGGTMKRIISSDVDVVFKGSGFYVNDKKDKK